jgi:tetratricopeptide (TPR) repeat protein
MLLMTGDTAGALAATTQARDIFQALLASTPDSTDYQRELSVSDENIAHVLLAQGDLPGALANYRDSLAIMKALTAKDPVNTGWQRDLVRYYRELGFVDLQQNDLASALANFKRASEVAPANAYAALWLDITERRNNFPSHLADAAMQLDMTTWPAPVVRLFLGELTPAQVTAIADNPDAYKQKSQVCEANFFSGELALLQGAKDEASRLFRLAASDCPRNLIEWPAANAELKALGAAP